MSGPYDKHGELVRTAYLLMALLTWPLMRLRRCGGQAVVLCYHGVKPHEAARFAWQVRRVAKRAIGVKDLRAGGIVNRRGPVVYFTFDDAFANLLDNALPTLRQHGVPACIFAVADNLGDRPRWRIAPDHPDAGERIMSGDELRRVVESGLVTVGSHTCTHPDLARLAPADVLRELRDSRRALADLVGQPVDDLALPHGSYTAPVLDAAFEAGYQRIYTLEPRPHTPADAPQVIGRFLMSPDAWRIEFLLTCAGAYAWLHPWRHLLNRLRRLVRRSAPQEAPAEPVST